MAVVLYEVFDSDWASVLAVVPQDSIYEQGLTGLAAEQTDLYYWVLWAMGFQMVVSQQVVSEACLWGHLVFAAVVLGIVALMVVQVV